MNSIRILTSICVTRHPHQQMRVLPTLPKICRFLFPSPVFSIPRKTMSSDQIRPMVISGPSGSGKSTLLEKLFKEFPGCFAFSVSHTTRDPRKGETPGVHYHFVTKDEFKKMIDEKAFLEHAEFSGNCYGTSKKAVLDIQQTGQICILDVEVNGVKNIKGTDLNARYVFVKPPNVDELEKRLRDRGTETEESLKRRLDSAKTALEYAEEKGSYDHIIVNDNLEVAYEKLRGILAADVNALQKEKMKAGE